MKKRILKYSGTAIGQLLFLTFFLFTLGITPVAADTAVWNGGTGNWDDTGNWSGGVVPNGADDDVLIDDGKATDSVVNLNMTATIGNLTIDENDTLNINNTRALYVTGGKTIANDGTLHINATTTSGASLLLSGDVTLTGTGTVSTSNHLYNKLYGTTGTEILTNDTGHTIQGSGRLGNNALLLVNKGLIAANQSNALTINLTGVRDDLNGTNSGTLRAEGGTLSIDDSGIANTGTLEARDGSQLVLKSTRINGGTLTTDGSGVIQLQNTAVISNVTNAAVVNVANSETGYVEGTIINNNTIQLNATTSSGARLLLSGDVILTGTGTVSMSDHYYNYLCATGSEVLTNDTGHTIQGSGHLGYNNMLLVNKGLIEADQSTALTVNLTGGRDDLNGTNSGTLRADGGTLSIDDSGFTNTGTLAARDGSQLELNNTRINGGTLTTDGTGVIQLQNSAVISNITNTGLINIANYETGFVEGIITNDNTIQLNATTASGARLRLYGDVTLTGTGTVSMSDYYYNYLYGATGSEVLTNDTGHTIQGSGHLGHNQMGIINQGLILANLTNNNLNINPYDSLGLTNSGTLQVNAGSTMIINDNLNNYTSNTLNGGTYKVYGTDTDPGTMRLPSGSDIINNAATILLDGPNANLYNGGTGTVDALANLAVNDGAGRFTIENGRNFTTAGAFANAGMVQVGYMVGDASTFTTTGAFTNTGTLQMQGGAFAAGTGGSLTNETTGEVNGYGTISTPVLNHGLVRAAGGNLIATIDGQSGTVRIDPDASLTLSGDSDAEYLIHNGSTADSLALGAYNFTVDKDYTNANFGVGNSFNRRANVSGSGQIIGNHAAQAITGDVTDGTTSTVTMDLGNVRGNESKTLNYQIANTGTGADIRGAVQTAVNGGNITDSRLSGTGVTADNFGPITAGNDSGDLGVTFSATSGGALDGQSIAIVSNFDNITTQVININGFASALAEGNATPNSPQPLVLGNFHVGTTSNPSRNFAVTNTTSGAGAEQLGIASATATGNFSAGNNLGTGLISGGATSTDAVTVQVSGGTAGINNGAVAIQYLTDGTNIDPTFTAQNANLQNIEVQATGYNLAVGSVLPSPIALANQRVGGTATQALTVANTAPADATYTETLSAQFGTDKGNAVNNGGSVSGIAGGSSNITALSAGVDTSVAGLRTGTVTINMTSHEVNGSGLGDTTLTPQTINVSGNVYQVAQPTLDSNNIVFANRRVGDTAQQALTITNTSAAPAGYQEALNASFSGTTGDAQAGGTLTQLGQGASDSTSLMVGIDTSTAGAKSGTADLALASDGTGTSGLGILALNPQTVTVSGAVYRLAEANTISPVNFGVVHVGDSVEQALAISNLAVADGYSESLNAFFGGVSDARILTTGSISLLGAGSTDNASMIVGIDTSAVGYVNGTATVNLQSDGTGTSGLGIVDLASQDVGVTADIVTGMVVRYANPLINTLQPVDMGNVRIGTTAETALSITNNVPNDGWSEYLIGAAGTTTGGITSSGSFASLAPEATDTTSITVGIDTATAGAKTGTATIDFQSDGTMFGGTITDLASQDVSVQGAVYRLANPTLDTPSVTLAARVGDASPTANVGMTNASPDSYTEGLKAGIGTSSTGFGATGSIANLAAMASDSSSLAVHLDTSTAGTFTGTADLTLFSTGTGTTGATDYALPGQSVALDGKVYTPAVGQIDSTTIDFGIVHVGETVSAQALTVKNNAAVTALNDVLTGSFTGSSGPFTVGGDLGSGLAAQATDSSSLTAAVDTSTAGVFNVSAMVNFASHNNDMADLDLGSVGIDIMAQVNNYADPVFQKNSGDGVLTVAGLTFTLDFGTIVFDHSVEAYLSLLNDVAGPADLLKGTFTDNTAEFGATGFDAFTDIEAGESLYDLFVSLDALTLGSFEESIVLHAIGYNAGGYEGAFDDITLILKGRVIESGGPTVPEPMTGLLLLIGLTGIGIIRKRFTN